MLCIVYREYLNYEYYGSKKKVRGHVQLYKDEGHDENELKYSNIVVVIFFVYILIYIRL